MGIVDALCSHAGCNKAIRWQSGDPRLCVEHGGYSYRPKSLGITVRVDMPHIKPAEAHDLDWALWLQQTRALNNSAFISKEAS